MHKFESTYWEQGLLVAGLDEVGRGCLAGPVVVAAVVLQPFAELPAVRDSKQLSAKQREALVPQIQACAAAWAIAARPAAEIDRVNIRQATLQAMADAVRQLTMRPQHLFIDGRDAIDCPITQTPLIDGDARCLSIAAASILAKVHRDQLMTDLDREFPAYGFAQHKGYGTPQHLAALAAHGPTSLHRESFAPVGAARAHQK